MEGSSRRSAGSGRAAEVFPALAEGVGELYCPAGGVHCIYVIDHAWVVLLPTQVLIFFTALLGAVFARSAGQLAHAVILGVAGQILAGGLWPRDRPDRCALAVNVDGPGSDRQ